MHNLRSRSRSREQGALARCLARAARRGLTLLAWRAGVVSWRFGCLRLPPHVTRTHLGRRSLLSLPSPYPTLPSLGGSRRSRHPIRRGPPDLGDRGVSVCLPLGRAPRHRRARLSGGRYPRVRAAPWHSGRRVSGSEAAGTGRHT